MKTEQLLEVLADIANCVEHDDSYDGSIVWEATRVHGQFEVYASYRVGNSMGQGGVVLIQHSKEEATAGDPW